MTSQTSSPVGVTGAVQQCVQLCKGKDATIKVLAQVFLESDFLIPPGMTCVPTKVAGLQFEADRSRLGSGMESTFSLWNEVLKEISSRQPSFLRIITEEMSIRIVQPSQLDITIDAYREAVYLWLIHILTTDKWAVPRKLAGLNPSCVISTCLMNPNYWSRRLATVLAVDTTDQCIKAQWGDLVQASNAQYDDFKMDGLGQVDTYTIKDHVEQVNAKISDLEQQAHSDSPGRGWVKWKGPWVTKPIGMV